MSDVSDWVKHFREMAAGNGRLKSGDVVEVRQYGGNTVPIKQVTTAAAGVARAKVKVKNAKAKAKKRVHKRMKRKNKQKKKKL